MATSTIENGIEILHAKKPVWVVTAVETGENYMLFVTFIGGEKKKFDCSHLIDKGVFKLLKNPEIFKLAHVEGSTVVWNDELDIAPETLYAEGVEM